MESNFLLRFSSFSFCKRIVTWYSPQMSVEDPWFPRGGMPMPEEGRQPLVLQNIAWKIKKLDWGGHASWCPLGSASGCYSCFLFCLNKNVSALLVLSRLPRTPQGYTLKVSRYSKRINFFKTRIIAHLAGESSILLLELARSRCERNIYCPFWPS